jgi:hypothetical protein
VIQLKLRSGEILEFYMLTNEAENTLVNKFVLGLTPPKGDLNLKQLGLIKIKDIVWMKRVESTKTIHKDEIVGDYIKGFSDLFGGYFK